MKIVPKLSLDSKRLLLVFVFLLFFIGLLHFFFKNSDGNNSIANSNIITGAVIGVNSPSASKIEIASHSTNEYIADLTLRISESVYSTNERIEVYGYLYISNYTSNGTLVLNHTGFANASLSLLLINKATNATTATYALNTTTGGQYYSRNDFASTSPLLSAPSTAGSYYIRVNYTDPNSTSWWTQNEIQVINDTVDVISVSGDKAAYFPSENMEITVEAVRQVGDDISYVANISINGTVRNSSKSTLSSFNCTTGAAGKCTVSVTAPSTAGDYLIEMNNFKAFTSFRVQPFLPLLMMKDELGENIKHSFATGEQASIEAGAITNSSSETYTFSGIVSDSNGNIVKSVTSTTLNYTNSYVNRFTFTLDAVSFPAGTYFVDINISLSGGGTVSAFTSFEVQTWTLSVAKREVGSGFEYEYSAFSNRTLLFDVLPAWKANGSVIDTVNTTTSINISLLDSLGNALELANGTWNASCRKDGCYQFNIAHL